MLGEKSGPNRSAAADALGKIGPEAKAAAPELAALLQDSDSNVSEAALTALAQIGTEAKLAVPVLTKLLKNEDRRVRLRAFQALCTIGPTAREALPGLVTFVYNYHLWLNLDSPEAMERIVRSGPAMVKEIVEWMH